MHNDNIDFPVSFLMYVHVMFFMSLCRYVVIMYVAKVRRNLTGVTASYTKVGRVMKIRDLPPVGSSNVTNMNNDLITPFFCYPHDQSSTCKQSKIMIQ